MLGDLLAQGNPGGGLSEHVRDFLRLAAEVEQSHHGQGLLHDRELLAVDVLDQLDRETLIVAEVANDHRHQGQASLASSAPPALPAISM